MSGGSIDSVVQPRNHNAAGAVNMLHRAGSSVAIEMMARRKIVDASRFRMSATISPCQLPEEIVLKFVPLLSYCETRQDRKRWQIRDVGSPWSLGKVLPVKIGISEQQQAKANNRQKLRLLRFLC